MCERAVLTKCDERVLALCAFAPLRETLPDRRFAFRCAAILLLVVAPGCIGFNVGTASLYAPDVATVYVPMIESDSYRRDLGERLTEAVCKEIELKTPYKVVSTPNADSILSVRLTRDTRKALIRNAFDDPRLSENEIRTQVNWLNRRRLPIVPA